MEMKMIKIAELLKTKLSLIKEQYSNLVTVKKENNIIEVPPQIQSVAEHSWLLSYQDLTFRIIFRYHLWYMDYIKVYICYSDSENRNAFLLRNENRITSVSFSKNTQNQFEDIYLIISFYHRPGMD